MRNYLVLLVIFIGTMSRGVSVGEPMQNGPQSTRGVPAFRFEEGARSVEVLGGAFAGFNRTPSEKRPAIDFASETLRAGWMLNSPRGEGMLRGNTEFLTGLLGGQIYQGPGRGLGGVALLLRYNFVQPDARLCLSSRPGWEPSPTTSSTSGHNTWLVPLSSSISRRSQARAIF